MFKMIHVFKQVIHCYRSLKFLFNRIVINKQPNASNRKEFLYR